MSNTYCMTPKYVLVT